MKVTEMNSRPNLAARIEKQFARIHRHNEMLADEDERHRLQVKNIEMQRREYLGYMAEFLGVDLTPDQLLERLDVEGREIRDLTVEEVFANHIEAAQ